MDNAINLPGFILARGGPPAVAARTGISEAHVMSLLRGRRPLTLSVLVALVNAYDEVEAKVWINLARTEVKTRRPVAA